MGNKKCLLLPLLLLTIVNAFAQIGTNALRDQLYQSFLTPPDSIRVGCYYYWVNERVDPKGVKADLQWMKDNGITLAFLATDQRILDDGTIIRFTEDSQFEVTFPGGHQEKWNPAI